MRYKKYPLNDATVIFSWFIDETINEILLKKFKTELQNDVQNNFNMVTAWIVFTDLVDFPIMVCRSPFRMGATIQDQLRRSIYNSNCIELTASGIWLISMSKHLVIFEKTYHRFLNILA